MKTVKNSREIAKSRLITCLIIDKQIECKPSINTGNYAKDRLINCLEIDRQPELRIIDTKEKPVEVTLCNTIPKLFRLMAEADFRHTDESGILDFIFKNKNCIFRGCHTKDEIIRRLQALDSIMFLMEEAEVRVTLEAAVDIMYDSEYIFRGCNTWEEGVKRLRDLSLLAIF